MKWKSEAFSHELTRACGEFARLWPEWSSTASLDALRAAEYRRLDEHEHVYLDFTGGGLYAETQLRRHAALLSEGVFGNPHSGNPSSLAMTAHVERAREAVLDFFNASPDEYLAVFTPNATGALRLVGEAYPFSPEGEYLLTYDNHNSVNGIREFARSRGAAVRYLPVHRPDMRLRADELRSALGRPRKGHRLFAYPAQSNFSGVQHSLEWVEEAKRAGWNVLLDAAAFVPSNRLDLRKVSPDFVALSFYKMFGYPTGVGCLLMRKEAAALLRRPWFSGGTIQIASVQGDGHYLATDAAAFEDGTVDYLSLPAVEFGLRHLDTVGIDVVHERVRCLTGWLLEAMSELRHPNGTPVVIVHGPRGVEARGGTIAFNVVDPDGTVHDIRRIEELANEVNISLRTGCFCNPGAGEVAFALTAEQISAFFRAGEGISFDELRRRIRAQHGIEIGAIRVSVGIASNFADAYRFVDFLGALVGRSAEEVGTRDVVAGEVGWMRDSA